MQGVILAGGKGTRLMPLTVVTNKHLASVGDLPMIEFPLHTVKTTGATQINVVTGGEHFSDVMRYLGAMHPDTRFCCSVQEKAGGIAQALYLVKGFNSEKKLAVILGDNVFEEDFGSAAREFEESGLGAMLFLKRVRDPERFGVAEIKAGRIVGIEEKPEKPKSNLAVTGLYFYDSSVFDKIAKLEPSARGELEITDVNNSYVKEGRVGYRIVRGFWSDAGTVPSRMKCDRFVRKGLQRKIIESLPESVRSTLPRELRYGQDL